MLDHEMNNYMIRFKHGADPSIVLHVALESIWVPLHFCFYARLQNAAAAKFLTIGRFRGEGDRGLAAVGNHGTLALESG